MFYNKNKEENTPKNNWLPLTDLTQLEEINLISNSKKVLIFKHSTRCSISIMALRMFEKSFDFSNENYTIYFLDLLNYRDISNAIANEYQVTHQSPQLLVIEKGKCSQHESHESISDMKF